MSIYSKLAVLIILFTFLVGCKAESPKSKSSDDSSSTSTDTGTGDTGTGTTSYVGKWINSNNTFGLDWKSDSFIYICTRINNVTFAGHGSYSSSNAKLTWWDGSYNSVTSSGSNILLGVNTYRPAALYATCNPFWTYHTTENTYYTNAAKIMGYWKFQYTFNSDSYTNYILMSAIMSTTYSDGNYYTAGTNSDGDLATGGYISSSGNYDILDANPNLYSDYFVFSINSTYTGISSGCYYFYVKATSTYSSCNTLTSGQKVYGTPRTYRIISENDKDKIALQKQKAITKLINQSSTRITAEDINAYNRYQHLLRIHNSTDKEPLKRFLHSFRTN